MENSPVLKKLRFDTKKLSIIVNLPSGLANKFEGVKFDLIPDDSKKGFYDFIILFATSKKELTDRIENLLPFGKYDCFLWICYPKMKGSVKSELNRDIVWHELEKFGIRPVNLIAIDETWSALRFRPVDAVGK